MKGQTMNNEHDIISTRAGKWICKCGESGQDKLSREQHIRNINVINKMLEQENEFEKTCT